MSSTTVQIVQLDHIALHVRDLEVSVRFFRDVLALPLIPRPAFPFAGAWFGLGKSQQLHLIAAHGDEVESATDGIHFALRVDDLDAATAHVSAAGHPFRGPKPRPDGFRQVFLCDPDGHMIELLGT
jgi:catechol 2,3-dioxygenase-like lactoylglutathione lyase family enzyme